MNKRILSALIVLLLISVAGSGSEIKIGITGGKHQKSQDIFKDLYGNKFTIFGGEGALVLNRFELFLEADCLSASGETSRKNDPLTYKEINLTAGVKANIISFKLSKNNLVKLFIGAGGTLLNYSEKYESGNDSGNIFGISLLGGVSLRIKNIGIALEAKYTSGKKDFELIGLGRTEEISFNGTSLLVKLNFYF